MKGQLYRLDSEGAVCGFLRECEDEEPEQYDPVRILRNVIGICPISFVSLQSSYLLGVISYFVDESGVRSLPYPTLGLGNPAIFFQAAEIILGELRKVRTEQHKTKAVKNDGGR